MTQGEKEVILSWFTDIANLVEDANEKKFTFQDNQDCLSEIMTRCLDSKQYIEEHCKPFPIELGEWKPSEEQMVALNEWLKNHQYDRDSRYYYPIFQSLYNDLKTL